MGAPLADRIRPTTLDQVVGQQHILGPGRALRKILEAGEVPNMVFYGPAGVGKTTVASLIAQSTKRHLVKLNGTTASTADIKEAVASTRTFEGINGVLLYLDEIQYFNKKQQQTLLEFMENGSITLIASTTENPYFYVYNAILSRSTVFEFKAVESGEIEKAVERAFRVLAEEEGRPILPEEGVCAHIASHCGGDVRKAMNAVELSTLACDSGGPHIEVTLEAARELTQRMLEHGRRRIVYIGGTERDDATGIQRREGVQDALRDAGLDGDQLPRICCNAFTVEEGQRCMQELLARCPFLDGVVCVTDTVAFGAMHALKQAGRQIGRDVGLAGIGDSWAGSVTDPGLATVRFYQKQVGQEAARILLQMLEEKEYGGPVRQVTLGYQVVERGSL